MKAKAIVRFKFPSEKHLKVVWEALKPEVDKPATPRFKGLIEKYGNSMVLDVEARDTVALRAALNAYLRWINSVIKVIEILEK